MNKYNENMIKSKEVTDLGLCTLSKCEKELKDSFNAVLQLIKATYDITKDKDALKRYEEGKKIVNGKMDIDAYKNFMKLLML